MIVTSLSERSSTSRKTSQVDIGPAYDQDGDQDHHHDDEGGCCPSWEGHKECMAGVGVGIAVAGVAVASAGWRTECRTCCHLDSVDRNDRSRPWLESPSQGAIFIWIINLFLR